MTNREDVRGYVMDLDRITSRELGRVGRKNASPGKLIRAPKRE